MQTGALLGPRIVKESLRPEHEGLFALYKRRGILVQFHSCGNVASVIDLFLTLGVDLLDPVRVTGNDLDALLRRTQGRMALGGGVGSAIVMSGPAKRIRAEVRRRL